ncbi:MaoC/PaaZ C-terminal domain-containing protein [Pseudochelatococcus sp. B33]
MAKTLEQFLVPWRSYDEIPDGFEFSGTGRTITEADLLMSALGGSFAPLHADTEWIRANTPFPDRLLPGTTILHYSLNQISSTLIYRYLIVAFLGLDKVRAKVPVVPGDTISSFAKIVDKRLTSGGDRAILKFEISVKNQRDEIAMTCEYTILIRLRYEDAA